eukprot:SAG11_NODE_245_length_11735_cov_3.939068_8_plen_182_part_00
MTSSPVRAQTFIYRLKIVPVPSIYFVATKTLLSIYEFTTSILRVYYEYTTSILRVYWPCFFSAHILLFLVADFSLAMANGRAVARCDFRMVHRALRDEPVPYVCRRDYQLRNKDGRPQRSWLRRGQVFQVYETCAEKGNVQLRMSDDDDLWVCGRARAYNGVQFSVAETKTSEIIAEPDLL